MSCTILSWTALWIKSTFIKCQCIVPPQWLGAHLRMCSKILQKLIVMYHLGLVQLHLVLPHLQTMYYDKYSVLMSWSSPLTTIELHALINNGHPTCINNASMVKSLTPVYISKDLSSSANLNTGGENNLLLSSPKPW
jgi:hypothetical protein